MAADGLTLARSRIAAAAARVGRDAAAIELLVVSKGQPDESIRELYEHGQRLFAENRADALLQRLDGDLPGDITWHFVGTVQRRKAKAIAPHIDLLHSMDRRNLEATWAGLPEAAPVLLQVNLAGEEQKHGYDPGDVIDAAARLTELGVAVNGLMVLPPAPGHPEDSRRWFVGLAELGAKLRAARPQATALSMGMSDDFEIAVECGSTLVRLGRTIFETPNDRQGN